MTRKTVRLLMCLLIAVSLCVMLYPAFSDYWNSKRQDELLTEYEQVAGSYRKEDFSLEWRKAMNYNIGIESNNIYGDVFDGDITGRLENSYLEVLNIAGNGVMGYIEIPKISVKIAIYHGVGDDVLQSGAGHMPGTKLPIGGSGTNSVIAAHRGLPAARLFTDIDQLTAGDVFYIHVLDETLCYRVDKVWAMVSKSDTDTMEEAMSIVPGEDRVSLFTCTPYGVNSHRLIVQGVRVNLTGDEILDLPVFNGMLRLVGEQNAMSVAAGFAALAFLMSLWALQGFWLRYRRISKEKKKEGKDKKDEGHAAKHVGAKAEGHAIKQATKQPAAKDSGGKDG